jgi:hypothetical protein
MPGRNVRGVCVGVLAARIYDIAPELNEIDPVIVLNPFGRRAFDQGDELRVPLRRGERLRLRFAALFYSIPAGAAAGIEAAYQAYAGE